MFKCLGFFNIYIMKILLGDQEKSKAIFSDSWLAAGLSFQTFPPLPSSVLNSPAGPRSRGGTLEAGSGPWPGLGTPSFPFSPCVRPPALKLALEPWAGDEHRSPLTGPVRGKQTAGSPGPRWREWGAAETARDIPFAHGWAKSKARTTFLRYLGLGPGVGASAG